MARFRPILLTSLTTFAGLSPLLLEKSLQAQILIPMAISLAFGVVFATVITLMLIPCLYLVLYDLKSLFSSKSAHEVAVEGLREDLESLGLELIPFGAQEAAIAADIWRRGGSRLALADRACLATAAFRGWPTLTADKAWAKLDVGVEVQVIR